MRGWKERGREIERGRKGGSRKKRESSKSYVQLLSSVPLSSFEVMVEVGYSGIGLADSAGELCQFSFTHHFTFFPPYSSCVLSLSLVRGVCVVRGRH